MQRRLKPNNSFKGDAASRHPLTQALDRMGTMRCACCILTGTAVLLGCSSLPPSASKPSDVAIAVTDSERPCTSLLDTVSVGLLIANRGSGTFRTYIDTLPGPPYKLSWLSYSVVRESPSGLEVEWKHGAGGHGPMPQNELAIGPRDATRLFANIYGAAEMDKAATYRIQIEDLEDQIYLSEPFTVCQPESASFPSNSSFKGTPLRGTP